MANIANAQIGRQFGARRLLLDNNDGIASNTLFFIDVNGTLGIDNTGLITASYPTSCGALLELSSTTKGFLTPRMTTLQRNLICGGAPPEGLIIYNNTTHTLDIWNGSAFAQLWDTKGNAGTNAATDFLGTTDAQDLVFRTNNLERARILSNGSINIPTTAASGPGIITQNNVRFIHSFGTNNFFAGAGAGNLTMTGSANTAIGVSALNSNISGIQNTAGGVNALVNNTTGSLNTASGMQALFSNLGGNQNTATGAGALQNSTTGSNNTATGASALSSNNSGFQNTGVGSGALNSNISGANNTAIGLNAGAINTTGSSNTFLGANTNAGSNNLTNATAIGLNAVVNASNSMVLGNGVNVIVANSGRLTVSDGSGTNNVVLVNGSPDATVANVAADPVWDVRVNGDQLVTGVQKIGGSIWLDGTSGTHQIVTDAPVNIGTKNGNNVNFVTGNTIRETIDAGGNVTDNGNLNVNGALTVGSGGSSIQKVIRASAQLGGQTLGATTETTYTISNGPFTGAAVGDPVFTSGGAAILGSGAFVTLTGVWVIAPNTVSIRYFNADFNNSVTFPNTTVNFVIIK